MNQTRDISRNVVGQAASLREAMERLNLGIDGIVLVVDEAARLVGVLTDGDIRRAFLAGNQPEARVADCMNREFTAARAGIDRREALALMSGRCRHLPLLDPLGRPVDLISWSEIWRVAVSAPHLGGNELKYVDDCLVNGWISSQGQYVQLFEEAFARYHGGGEAVSTTSGTSALHLVLAALGVGPGDEVIVPDLTFGASANAVLQCGAKPVFVDVDRHSWTLDVDAAAMAITPRTRAIMPVHLYGHPCDMNAIAELAKSRNLHVVEDCAEALGATFQGRPVGSFGVAGCFSFFANKLITTGEGGMVLTADAALAARMRMLRSHGMDPKRRYWHLAPGFNYRMTNVQAAIGLAQLEQIDRFLARRRAIAAAYEAGLSALPGLELPRAQGNVETVCWLYTVLVDAEECGLSRDALMARLLEAGIETRTVFPPLHGQPAYLSGPAGSYPVSEAIAGRGLSLPTSNAMDVEDVQRIVAEVRASLGRAVTAGGA
jgi:perosamine synthetase